MRLNVVPEGLGAVAAALESLTAQLLAEQAQAGAAVAAIEPPAADPVSIQAALSILAHGARQQAACASGAHELSRSGLRAEEASASYQEGDDLGAAAYAPGAS